MKLEPYDTIYFLGIGGIGMSALVRWFVKKGVKVYGYDKTSTTLTSDLMQEGVGIHFEDRVANIPAEVTANAPAAEDDQFKVSAVLGDE